MTTHQITFNKNQMTFNKNARLILTRIVVKKTKKQYITVYCDMTFG